VLRKRPWAVAAYTVEERSGAATKRKTVPPLEAGVRYAQLFPRSGEYAISPFSSPARTPDPALIGKTVDRFRANGPGRDSQENSEDCGGVQDIKGIEASSAQQQNTRAKKIGRAGAWGSIRGFTGLSG